MRSRSNSASAKRASFVVPSARLEAQQPAHDGLSAGFGARIDLEDDLVIADACSVSRAGCQNPVGLGQIVEASVGEALAHSDREAFAGRVDSLEHEFAAITRMEPENFDYRRPRIEYGLMGRILQAERGRGCLGRLSGGDFYLAAIAVDLGTGNLAAVNFAALGADNHRSANNDLVLAGFQIAENKRAIWPKFNYLAGANVVHEFHLGSSTFHVLHQGCGYKGRRQVCRGLGRNDKSGGQRSTFENLGRHWSIS